MSDIIKNVKKRKRHNNSNRSKSLSSAVEDETLSNEEELQMPQKQCRLDNNSAVENVQQVPSEKVFKNEEDEYTDFKTFSVPKKVLCLYVFREYYH